MPKNVMVCTGSIDGDIFTPDEILSQNHTSVPDAIKAAKATGEGPRFIVELKRAFVVAPPPPSAGVVLKDEVSFGAERTPMSQETKDKAAAKRKATREAKAKAGGAKKAPRAA